MGKFERGHYGDHYRKLLENTCSGSNTLFNYFNLDQWLRECPFKVLFCFSAGGHLVP